jgi:WD40 repeat protein
MRQSLQLLVPALLVALASPCATPQARPDVVWLAGGHGTRVTAVAYSPDGSAAATVSYDFTVKLWRTSDGALLGTVIDRPALPSSVAVAPDGSMIAVGYGSDTATPGIVRILRAFDGATVQRMAIHPFGVSSLAFSPDGAVLATAGGDKALRFWRTADWTLQRTVSDLATKPYKMVYTPDGSTLVYVGPTGTLVFLRASDATVQRSLALSTAELSVFAISPDGSLLATAGSDKTIGIRRMSDLAKIGSTPAHSAAVTALSFSPDGGSLASTDGSTLVRLWRTADQTLAGSFAAHPYSSACVAYSPDGTALLTGGSEGAATIWDLPSCTLRRNLCRHRDMVRSVAYSPDGSALASGGYDRTVKVWRSSDGELLRTLDAVSAVRSVAYSPDGTLLAAACADGLVRLWRTSDGVLVGTLAGHTGAVLVVAFSPDGATIASGGGYPDSSVRLWRASDGAPLQTITRTVGAGLAFSPDSTLLAVPGGLYRASDGSLVLSVATSAPLAFVPDGSHIAYRGAALRRVSDGALVWSHPVHADTISCTAVSRDGGIIASGAAGGLGADLGNGLDRTVTLQLASDGGVVATYDEETGPGVTSIAFSPDGAFMAFARTDGSLMVSRYPYGNHSTSLNVPDASGRIGETVTLSATLTSAGAGVEGRTITFAIGSDVLNAVTSSQGVASVAYTIPVGAGAGVRAVTATFAGDTTYTPSSASSTLTVSRNDTEMWMPDRSGVVGEAVALKAYIWGVTDRKFLSGKVIKFRVDGAVVGQAASAADGGAVLNWSITTGPTTRTLASVFAADAAHNGSSAASSLTANVMETKLYLPDRSGVMRGAVVLKAYLYMLDNRQPPGGKSITFKVAGTAVGSAPTSDPNLGTSVAQLLWPVPGIGAAGAYALRADWAGDSGYKPSFGTATLTLVGAPTYIWPYVRSTRRGTPMALSAYVRSLWDYAWQPGLQITFSIDGTEAGSAATDGDGVARFTVADTSGLSVGSHTMRASFAGSPSLAAGYGETTVNVVGP